MNFFNQILKKKHIGLLKFNDFRAEKFRKGFLNLEKNASSLEAVAFIINSTGESAVSSNTISNTLTTFCKTNNLKLYTFAQDYALSGGYWLLSIGDEVFSMRSSKVGSIGALLTSIDFKSFLEKRNIDQIYISSKKEDGSPDLNKILDAFEHKNEKEIEFLKELITDVHSNFKNHVMKYRKDKLTTDPVYLDRLLNADIFIGEEAKQIGLIDNLGDYRSILKERFPKLKIKDYTNNSDIIMKETLKIGSSNFLISYASKLLLKF